MASPIPSEQGVSLSRLAKVNPPRAPEHVLTSYFYGIALTGMHRPRWPLLLA